MAGYLGAIPVPQATQHRESFTATSGQTTFNTAGYTVGFLDVYLNGSHLSPADFTATNGSDVVLASGASTGDVCDIISYTAFEIADQTFTGTTTMDVAAITGVLTTTAATVFNGGFTANDGSTISTADNTTQLTLISTDADANKGPALDLYRNSGSPAAGDDTGRINFQGENDADEAVTYTQIFTEIVAVGDGVESGRYKVGAMLAGDFASRMDMTASETVFNDDSKDLNFRVESNNHTDALFVDAGDDKTYFGKSSSALSAAGIEAHPTGRFMATLDGGLVAQFNRLSNDGDILEFYKDGTAVGSIESRSGNSLSINTGNSGVLSLSGGATNHIQVINSLASGTPRLQPSADNTVDLGASGNRFDDIFATNGTIQTSDRNEKQDIASLTSAEMLVAKRISALFKTFRWKDKVAAKGNDARTHTGIIAQDVQAAFTAESLDAGDYSLFISSTWWEHDVDVPAVEADEDNEIEAQDAYTRTDTYVTEDEAPEGATSKTRMGIRYPELLSFVAAYNEQRFASIETRLTALEG